MKVIYGIGKIKKFRKPVVALGVFDGIHRGHKVILQAAVRKARQISGTAVALTFWPHPQKEESLSSLEHRLRLIQALGIDACIVINFNQGFARMRAEDFIKNILAGKLHADYLYVGKNFRFGRAAQGNYRTLSRLSRVHNFKLKTFKVIKINHKPVSSTYIRKLIKRGELRLAQKLLTRRVSILGTVIKGDSLARKLGFPTANVNPHHEVTPPYGVYAVRVIFGAKKFNGICYIGNRPTLKRREKKGIEVYIFDFKQDIYGGFLEIQFLKKIREERKFTSLSLLAKQVKKDLLTAKKLFSYH